MALRDITITEQPREKALLYGIDSLSNQELLAILLRTGSRKESVLDISNKILKKVEGVNGLKNITLNDLMSIEGIKQAKALTILASIELNKRIRGQEKVRKQIMIRSSAEAYDYVKSRLEYENQEKVLVLFLNNRKELLKEKIIFTGTSNMSIISPKEIYKEAIAINAAGIILFHNHPSGNPEPSQEDQNITAKISLAGQFFDIELIDHIIIGNGCYYSLKEHHLF